MKNLIVNVWSNMEEDHKTLLMWMFAMYGGLGFMALAMNILERIL